MVNIIIHLKKNEYDQLVKKAVESGAIDNTTSWIEKYIKEKIVVVLSGEKDERLQNKPADSISL